MGLTEKLNSIKSQTDALISYANGVTGESDTRIGDAVRTLADGFGGGGVDLDNFPNYPDDEDADLWFTTWFPSGTKKVLSFINPTYTLYSGTIENGVFNVIKTTQITRSDEQYLDGIPNFCHHKLVCASGKTFGFKQGTAMSNDLGFYNNVVFIKVPSTSKITSILDYAYTGLAQQKTLKMKMYKNLYSQNVKFAQNMNELYIDGGGSIAGASTYNMFFGMYSLRKLTLRNVDYSANTGAYLFQNNYNLIDVVIENSVLPSAGAYLNSSRFLTRDSVLNIFNALPEVDDKTIRLHADTKALLSADDLAIATNKGYTIK